MNKQRMVVITITYNEMGIIIDTKAEEIAQPNLQSTCNQLATDTISRQAAIDAFEDTTFTMNEIRRRLYELPSAQPEIIRCKDCKYRDENQRMVTLTWLPCMDVRTGSNWYCGSAERR